MPNQPLDQIHIRIGTQEQRSGIPEPLATLPEVHIEVTPCPPAIMGVGGDPYRVLQQVFRSRAISLFGF